MNHPRTLHMTRQLIEGALVETSKLHTAQPTPSLRLAVEHLTYALDAFDAYYQPTEQRA
jgi:hypothetical protein